MRRKKFVTLTLALLCAAMPLTGCNKSKEEQKGVYEDNTSNHIVKDNKEDIDNSNDTIKKDTTTSENGQYKLAVHTSNKVIEISDMLYGLFFEDINFAGDGGLYAEMIQNRSFEFEDSVASRGGLHGYQSYREGELSIQTETPLNENNPHYVRIENTTGVSAGLSNAGFLEGMTIKEGASYRFSVYLKSDQYLGRLKVSLISNSSQEELELASDTISGITKEWQKYEVILKVTEDAKKAKLVLTLEENGTVDADMVSLFPTDTYKNRENGLRADLVTFLEDLHPSFIRFPGGCIVEGNTMETAYCWKDTVGDVAERKQNINLWNSNKNYPYYQSYGLGFYEYFLLCEDLGAEPVPILNCGMACQVRTNITAPINELDTYIQDALDLIEFANGDVSTTWGALRAKMGHPEPFQMKYLGIGNEQWQSGYFSRYEKFQEVLRKEHPEILLITTSGPSSNGDLYEYAWNRVNSHNGEEVLYADLVDEHYYNAPEWFLSNVTRYDAYDRAGANVFLGEYAAKSNTLYAAIAEAAYMTGLERNSDLVKMTAYAPLFGNLHQSQWSPDLIWFNNSLVFGSVNYYVQKLFAENKGDYIVESKLDTDQKVGEIHGRIGLGTWLTSAEFDDVKVVDNKTGEILYETDFHEKEKDWISSGQGEWRIVEDDGNSVFAQKNAKYPTDNAIMGSAVYIGENSWSDYTFTCKAKKVSGAEGFLIPFAVKDLNNFYHWNIGGWGNTLSVVEQAQGGAKTNVCSTVPIQIKTGQWYEIKVVVAPNLIECYLDDKLIHSFPVESVLPIYETSSIQEETGELIIKLVNANQKEENVHIALDTVPKGKASVTVLGGLEKNVQNSKEKPEEIIPNTSELEISEEFEYMAPKYSVTIFRIPLR